MFLKEPNMSRKTKTCMLLGTALLGLLLSARPLPPQGNPPVRSKVSTSSHVYRVQNDNPYTVFLVSSEGIILSDPINRDFATWLKGELQRRFNKTVRYVLYTHHHWDHASGGSVFADTAQFI